ncbi:MAG: AAA family ATPase, partial [Clostridia bacterium]
MHETVLEAEDLDSLLLVGRNQEIQLFVNSLEDPVHSKRVLNVYGTAGIGKSSLLDEFQRLARKRGVMTIFIDSQKFVQTPSSFCLHILQALQHFESFPEDNPSLLLETCVKTLNEHAQHQQITLFLDTYETMESMDHWLREYFFKQLAKNILIVIAGRYPLSEPWLLSPTWRQQMVRLPLNELDYAAVEKYARYCHIFDESLIQRMWRHSKGHPLTLSLVAFTVQQSTQLEPDLPKSDYDTLPYIVSQWLREVPGEHLRP